MSDRHDAQIALMRFLSAVARRAGVADHVYVVGGAVRDFVMGRPIKDVDVVVDAVSLGRGRDSAWFAERVVRSIPTAASYVTNQYGVAIITVKGPWTVDGQDLTGEVIEIANARKESYGAGGDSGKGYKPTDVQPATIMEDVERREFTWNTLLWRLRDLADGPAKAEVIDLTGCGIRDLREGVMRCPRDPDVVFSDDPTRMLRLVKFVGRYGFKVPPDVAAAVRRNAGKMANAPWEAIATILVRDVLDKPYARRVLPMMRDLGLFDAIVDMIAGNPPFRTYLERELRGKPAHLVADLLRHGLSDPTPVRVLTPAQRARFVEVVEGLSPTDAQLLADALQRPPVDNNAIIAEFALRPEQRGRIAPLAREALLVDPTLASDPAALTDAVRAVMSGTARTAKEHIPGGRARGKSPSAFDPDELERGIKVELEHTPDRGVAREIAMDHLTEFPDYYTRLDRMESEAKGKTAKLIETLWLVTDPTPDSEIIDILVGFTDWDHMRDTMVGSGPRWSKERPAFHDDFKSAYADAMTRLRRIHGQDIPGWVLANEGPEGVFRMASRVAATIRVPDGTLSGLDRMGSEARAKTAGDREVTQYKNLRAYWEYNGPLQRFYGVYDIDSNTKVDVGQILLNKDSLSWTVSVYPNWPASDDIKTKLTAFSARDAREGVKRSLMAIYEYRNRRPEVRVAKAPKKYDHIDFKPPKSVADAAEKGLELRQKASPSNRGGFTPAQAAKEGIGSGVQRAVNLKNRDTVSPDVIRQMVAFFARHEKNKDVPADKKGEPWNAKGYVAWLLWGGDPGRRWAEKVRDQMDAADEAGKTASLEAAWGAVIPRNVHR